jgi:hypothetical protein
MSYRSPPHEQSPQREARQTYQGQVAAQALDLLRREKSAQKTRVMSVA